MIPFSSQLTNGVDKKPANRPECSALPTARRRAGLPSSPASPAAAKIQVANQLKGLGTDLLNIEPDQIVIERTPA
jgi:hypothetical protein